MQRTELSPEITRIVLTPADDVPFHPISFQDQAGEYLTQTGCVFTPRQVWRLSGNNEVRSVRQTANGEAVSFDTGWMVYPNGWLQLSTPYGGK